MKRSTDNRRSPAEIGIDLQMHCGGMAEHMPDPQADRGHDGVPGGKYNIRGDADDDQGST